MLQEINLLNLGCGKRYHKDWVNLDFVSTGEGVIAHNLSQGIPFGNGLFEVVYHSHVLEHFSKKDGVSFIQECFRVLKPGGIIRVAVPDLERIVENYLEQLRRALAGDQEAAYNYEWIMLELYDQTVRNYSGGAMTEYLYQENIPNEKFVYQRLGDEARDIRESFKKYTDNIGQVQKGSKNSNTIKTRGLKKYLNLSSYKRKIKSYLLKDELKRIREKELYFKKVNGFIEIGRFRLSGEVHQWMYDRYSLTRLLQDVGFNNPQVKTAYESIIPQWTSYELESKNGVVYKPDSLFMEAVKL